MYSSSANITCFRNVVAPPPPPHFSAANSFTAGSRDINNPTPLLTPNNNNITSNSSEDNNQSDIPNSEVGLPEPSSSDEASGGVDAAGMPIGFQGSSAILPDIQIVTGQCCSHVMLSAVCVCGCF